jgi:hypothetical protein
MEALLGPVREKLFAQGHWWGVAFVGLAPIPAAWIIIYMLATLYRWIRRGFVEAA